MITPAPPPVLPSEEQFHQLVDAVTDYAIFMLDHEGRVATWNRGAEKAKGYRPSEIIGQHLSVFYTPEDRAAGRPQKILDIVRTKGRYEEQGWRVRKDGTRFWANVVITLLKNDAGVAIGFAKVTRDLTERSAANEALLQSEERFRLLVESLVDYALYMLDPKGNVTTWNLGAQRMKGYSTEEIVGKNIAVFFPEEDVTKGKPAHELAVAEAEGRFEDEGWRVRKDGSRFWANVVVTPVRDPIGRLLGFAKVTRDLTARREAEQMERNLLVEQAARSAAQRMADRAEETNRMRDDFLATVSHELRTPLNAIVGWSSLLKTHDVPREISRGLDVIDRNARAQVRLVEDILDVSRVITGKLRIEPVAMDLGSVVTEAIDVVRPSATAKGITIDVVPTEDSLSLVGDPERLQQLVWNLLSNAVKFTPAGGAVRIELARTDESIELRVHDTGRGIDPEFLPYVFERFRQGDSSTTRRFGGLGLGLALVRSIVELHGGVIEAKSAGKDRGTTFTVSLPLRATPSPPALDAVGPRGAARPADCVDVELHGIRVMVVEDEADTRELFREVLVRAGAEVFAAESAARAIAGLSAFRPHILVSDIGMPDEDGYSFVRRLRALAAVDGGEIPAIALTAYTRNEDRAKALAAGFTTHIGKPIIPSELVAIVRALATGDSTVRPAR